MKILTQIISLFLLATRTAARPLGEPSLLDVSQSNVEEPENESRELVSCIYEGDGCTCRIVAPDTWEFDCPDFCGEGKSNHYY